MSILLSHFCCRKSSIIKTSSISAFMQKIANYFCIASISSSVQRSPVELIQRSVNIILIQLLEEGEETITLIFNNAHKYSISRIIFQGHQDSQIQLAATKVNVFFKGKGVSCERCSFFEYRNWMPRSSFENYSMFDIFN